MRDMPQETTHERSKRQNPAIKVAYIGAAAVVVAAVITAVSTYLTKDINKDSKPSPIIACDGGWIKTGPGEDASFSNFTMPDNCTLIGDANRGTFIFKDEKNNIKWTDGAVFAISTKQLSVKQFDWRITDGQYKLVKDLEDPETIFCEEIANLYKRKISGESTFSNVYPILSWGYSLDNLLQNGKCK